MDLAGKQLQLPQQRNTQQQTLSLNVSNLNIGLYLLKIVNTANNKTQTLRFIKE
jgi:hypothetical protein